ncbi:MAG TPA: PilZ domain-containing protein [Telluria sp.]|nr:PilZ domain-containing protein [Telluria sp.]
MVVDQRKSVRKVLKTKAMLALDGRPPVAGRCSDIGANGLSVSFPDPIEANQSGWVRFDLLVDGNIVHIQARVKALYCIFSQNEFKVGFQFTQLDLAANTTIARFLR